MIQIKKSYTFDDVLLVPKLSEVSSRDEVDLSVDLGKGVKLKSPIVSANMKTVTGPFMASEIARFGGLPILHRFTENRIADYRKVREFAENGFYRDGKVTRHNWLDIYNKIGVSVGIADSEKEFLKALFSETECNVVCVDIAHAHSTSCLRFVEYIAAKHPDVLLIAGNVATAHGACQLAGAGADVVKVGIGGGSICSTRDTTGFGVPQLTAIMDVAEAFDSRNINVKIISDGGLKKSGNIVKALCFADAVMLGTMLAGSEEAPGTPVEIDGQLYKEYVGSSTYKAKYVEGITSRVKHTGYVDNLLETISDGIRSGCSYGGVRNLNDLKINPEFIEVTNAGLQESNTHAIIK